MLHLSSNKSPVVPFRQAAGLNAKATLSGHKGVGQYDVRTALSEWQQAQYATTQRSKAFVLTINFGVRETDGLQACIDRRLQTYEHRLAILHRPMCIRLRQRLAREHPNEGFTQKGQERLFSGLGVFEHAASGLHAHILVMAHPRTTPEYLKGVAMQAISRIHGKTTWNVHAREAGDLSKALDYITKETRLLGQYWHNDEVRLFPL